MSDPAAHFPRFRPRAPWWGPDLQTLRNPLVARRTTLSGALERRLLLPMRDGSGDRLVGSLAEPTSAAAGGARPLIVLVHGLGGAEDSAYMIASADHWLALGHRVLRLNLRGAGPSREHCRLQYHAGRSEDLDDALAALPPGLLAHGVVLVGYSLGGNVLLKFVAESGARHPLLAAASVSAPIDLAAASQRFLAARNRFYHAHLLRSMRRESLAAGARISEAEREHVLAVRTIYDFDDRFVAPRNGFRDAEHYYAECNARRSLARIAHPTLLVHALDDPWIPADAYTGYDWGGNPNLTPLLSPGGGHVGFHDRGGRTPWHDRCIAQFVARVIEGTAAGLDQGATAPVS